MSIAIYGIATYKFIRTLINKKSKAKNLQRAERLVCLKKYYA